MIRKRNTEVVENTYKGKLKDAIGYIRVSTEGQANEDKYGVDVQKSAITEYAAKNGYRIVDWAEDHVSGISDERPAFNNIIYGNVENPPIEAVIVFKNDRIARDTKLYFYYLYTLEKKDIKLISTEEEFDEGSEFANLYRAMMQFVAEQERKNITLRTSSGRIAKAKKGGYAGGRPPYGYKVVDNELIVDREEAEMVRFVFDRIDKGISRRQISNMLNDSGLKTRSGSPFQATNVINIENNKKFYQGYYKYGKDKVWVKGKHQPIIEDDEPEYDWEMEL